MDIREDALVQLTRLGLKGDAASVSRFAKRFLRQAAGDSAIAETTKKALAELVASQIGSPMRFVDPSPTTGATGFLSIEPDVANEESLLSGDVANEVNEVISEHKRAADLADAGLVPTRTVLLTGPPGVGKTLTARSMAQRLGVPLFRADLSALMSSYLGKTGQNLVEALTRARAFPSVMLLDEFDAIAKRRDDPTDVGELKRIVNVLLLELEAWPSSSLLVAATNHPELLDRAIWRRFEKVINIGLPEDNVRRVLLERQLARFKSPASKEAVDACVLATAGLSCSDVVSLANACVKRSILSGKGIDQVLYTELLGRFYSNAQDSTESRRAYCEVASRQLGMSQREIAAQLRISHVMVGKLLRKPADKTRHRSNAPKGGIHG
jgi:SpoVK/Ycf46/Vps4 family AAA+-type ATPase